MLDPSLRLARHMSDPEVARAFVGPLLSFFG